MTVDQVQLTETQAADVRGPRSPRTVGAVLVAVAALVAGGGLLYDVIAVRAGHRAKPWRVHLAHTLETRHLDDPWVRLGAGVALLLGLWLCWLALAPGLRRWLPLSRPGSVIDRHGVAALLALRAEDYPGVAAVRIRVGHSRTKVTLRGTADPAIVQRDLREELARIPLAAPNRLDVRVRRAEKPHR